MKKVYYLDNVVIFSSAGEFSSQQEAEGAGCLIVEPEEADARLCSTLSLTKLQQIFETAKSVAVVLPTREQADRAFELFASQFIPVHAAGGVVLSPEKEILMIYRNGKWDLPKGKIEEGEQTDLCALREVGEECGIGGMEIERLLTHTYHIYMEQRWILKKTTWYSMKHTAGQPLVPQQEEGITDVRWVSREGLPSYVCNTYPAIRDVLAAL